MFKKILVADGDEAAIRIMRARQELGNPDGRQCKTRSGVSAVVTPIPEGSHDGHFPDLGDVISPVEGEPESCTHESSCLGE
jgi:hypothetical protein